jgi:hypothetical protein
MFVAFEPVTKTAVVFHNSGFFRNSVSSFLVKASNTFHFDDVG